MSNVSVLISSCDKYSDCWSALSHGFDKYWPDCPFPIYLVSNVKEIAHPRIHTIKTARETEWPQRMAFALNSIPSEFILYMQEDYWITGRVNSELILSYTRFLEEGSAYHICLMPFRTFGWDLLPFTGERRLGIIAPSASFRTALQAALWKKKIFLELMNPDETLWEFEHIGTERSRKYSDKFLCVRRGSRGQHYGIPYTWTAVVRGCWARVAKKYVRDEMLELDFSHRPSTPWSYELRITRLGTIWGYVFHTVRLLITNPLLLWRKVCQHVHDGRRALMDKA